MRIFAAIFVMFIAVATTTAAYADVRNVCNGGMCRTIVTDKDNKIIWISELWQQH